MSDPFTVLWIDPDEITHSVARQFDRWRHMGEVHDGNWDQTETKLTDHIKYRSVVNHFQNDIPWEETDIYQEAISRVQQGESYWNGCRTDDDVKSRAQTVEELYASIENEGFRSQEELHGKSVKAMLLSGSFDRSKTDISVAIGRDGEFLFIDGNHRLAIAHVLDVDLIPVRVVVRHKKWHQTRQQTIPSGQDDVDPTLQDHPDIK